MSVLGTETPAGYHSDGPEPSYLSFYLSFGKVVMYIYTHHIYRYIY
jgi:hypothetical protein